MEKTVSQQKEHVNVNIKKFESLINLNEIRQEIPQPPTSQATILKGRKEFKKILHGEDHRFVVITGPCSIHDEKAAYEYADKLKVLNDKYQDKLLIMMRVYFEKPRTTTGWKGLINDPFLNNTLNIQHGIKLSRKILINISNRGLYTATEILDPITAAYLSELVVWVAIGARTTESQIHREMVSGLSTPVGFKNGTNGNLDIACNAINSAKASHSFLGVDDDGRVNVIRTRGNPHTHIVLRGGIGKPNYSKSAILETEKLLSKNQCPLKIMVDCSHDNSGKNHEKQASVAKDILKQKMEKNQSIFGIMLESHLSPGNQPFPQAKDKLKYGVSITDKCIDFEENEKILDLLYKNL